jgi:hypothetical protein
MRRGEDEVEERAWGVDKERERKGTTPTRPPLQPLTILGILGLLPSLPISARRAPSVIRAWGEPVEWQPATVVESTPAATNVS